MGTPSMFTGTASTGIAKRRPVTVSDAETVSRSSGHGSKQARTPGSAHDGGSTDTASVPGTDSAGLTSDEFGVVDDSEESEQATAANRAKQIAT